VKTLLTGIALVASMVGAAPAWAQTPAVNAARAAGQVGERFDGYLGVAGRLPTQVRSQVDAINIRRRTIYSNFATSRGVSPQEVAYTAGCQLLARVAVGEVYMLADNAWRRRQAGQRAPVPNYCG
jgi:uncharacterized protein YdbL (DUF1318 family)